MNTKPLEQLLETEMDRKEFLLYLGASLLAVVGISGLVKAFAPPSERSQVRSNSKLGYGDSPYGG